MFDTCLMAMCQISLCMGPSGTHRRFPITFSLYDDNFGITDRRAMVDGDGGLVVCRSSGSCCPVGLEA
jgi:hypothetical protein